MNILIVLTSLISWCSCGAIDPTERPTGQGPKETASPVPILSYENESPKGGSYKYKFETANGILVQEQGFRKLSNDSPVAGGTYSYTAPTGELIVVTWHADENGFRSKQRIVPKGSDKKEYSSELRHGPFTDSIRYSVEGGWRKDVLNWFVDEKGLHLERIGYLILAGVRPIG